MSLGFLHFDRFFWRNLQKSTTEWKISIAGTILPEWEVLVMMVSPTGCSSERMKLEATHWVRRPFHSWNKLRSMFRSIHSAETRENQFNGNVEQSSVAANASYLIVASSLSAFRLQKKVDRLTHGSREHRSEMWCFDEQMTFRKYS